MKTRLTIKPSELVRKGWCKGKLAEDENGYSVPVDDFYSLLRHTVKWCALGAIRASNLSQREENEYCRQLEKIVGHIAEWNDTSTQDKVVEMLEKVEEIVSGKEKNETK